MQYSIGSLSRYLIELKDCMLFPSYCPVSPYNTPERRLFFVFHVGIFRHEKRHMKQVVHPPFNAKTMLTE